ncbi:MAG: hypothetical protein VB051_07180 [Candidatus Pelethousia sp.]|nr:hypothetical protein [Candidatus Pelethousia sp.]
MRTKTIPLLGRSKALLRLEEGEGRGQLALSPPCPGAMLYLIGPGAEALAAELDEEGRGSLALPFSPVAALAYAQGAFVLAGGFAGRSALLERAKVAVRLQTPTIVAAPAADLPPPPACPSPPPEPKPEPPPEPKSEPEPETQTKANAQPAQTGPAQQTCGAGRAESRRPQSEALLAALQKAQELFHGAAPAPAKTKQPAPAPEPAAIPNPFPRTFPQSSWRRVNYPGALGHYLCGEGTSRSGAYTVYALPGEYAPVPPRGKGFDKFVRASDGSGYWVRIVRKGNMPRP